MTASPNPAGCAAVSGKNMLSDMSWQQRIEAAHRRIAAYVRRTPVFTLSPRSFDFDGELTLKLETFQYTGSYKPRGVFNRLLSRTDVRTGQTIVAASGGNHGIAVAYAAQILGFQAEIFVPQVTPKDKIMRIRAYGATVTVSGSVYGDALVASEQYAKMTGALTIHAFDEPELIEGQGSVALEFGQQAGTPDTVLVAAGGGSLLAGVAAWYAGSRTRVIGVEPETACAVTSALAAGRPIDVQVSGVAADSLGARRAGQHTFAVIHDNVSQMLLVTDDWIVRTQQQLWQALRLVVEPGGATAFAALLSGGYQPQTDERIAIIICGANTDPGSVRT